MSLDACAERVRRADPERFMATLALAPEERARLWPLFAFNLEIARAPWASPEPMIAEMRLQFWHDVLDRIADGAAHYPHEIAAPLRGVIEEQNLDIVSLQEMVAARRRDLEHAPFADETVLWRYLDRTAGNLMWLAGRALGAHGDDAAPLRAAGQAQGMANWLRAVPVLAARGRQPLPDARPEAVVRLAGQGLERLARIGPVSVAARRAMLAGFMARPMLVRAARRPERVWEGRLAPSPFRSRLRLLRLAFLGGRT